MNFKPLLQHVRLQDLHNSPARPGIRREAVALGICTLQPGQPPSRRAKASHHHESPDINTKLKNTTECSLPSCSQTYTPTCNLLCRSPAETKLILGTQPTMFFTAPRNNELSIQRTVDSFELQADNFQFKAANFQYKAANVKFKATNFQFKAANFRFKAATF